MNRFLFGVAIGAAAMYFLDPESGPHRRALGREKAERVMRRMGIEYEFGATPSESGSEEERAPSQSNRLAIGALGFVLLMGRGLVGRVGGAALLARAVTNLPFASLAGSRPEAAPHDAAQPG